VHILPNVGGDFGVGKHVQGIWEQSYQGYVDELLLSLNVFK
jgi:hypothetical protein